MEPSTAKPTTITETKTTTTSTTKLGQTVGAGNIHDYLSWLFVRIRDKQTITFFLKVENGSIDPDLRLFTALRKQITHDLPYRTHLNPKRRNHILLTSSPNVLLFSAEAFGKS